MAWLKDARSKIQNPKCHMSNSKTKRRKLDISPLFADMCLRPHPAVLRYCGTMGAMRRCLCLPKGVALFSTYFSGPMRRHRSLAAAVNPTTSHRMQETFSLCLTHRIHLSGRNFGRSARPSTLPWLHTTGMPGSIVAPSQNIPLWMFLRLDSR